VGDAVDLVDRDDLIVEVHRFENEGTVLGAEGAQVFLRPHDEAGNSDLLALFHRLDEEAVGLGALLLGDDVVGAVEVDGVNVAQRDEVFDLDGLTLSRGGGFELGLLDDDVLAGGDLVALTTCSL
jgi:hypothetical protein